MAVPTTTLQSVDELARAGDWDGLRAVLKAVVKALEAEGERRAQATSPMPDARHINAELGAYQAKAFRDADVAASGFVPACDELQPALAAGAARGRLVLLGACDDMRYRNLVDAFVGMHPVRPGPVDYVTSLHLDRPEHGRALLDALRKAWPEL